MTRFLLECCALVCHRAGLLPLVVCLFYKFINLFIFGMRHFCSALLPGRVLRVTDSHLAAAAFLLRVILPECAG